MKRPLAIMKTLFVVKRIRGKAWDSTKPLRSQARWYEHAAFMDELAANRFVVLGGPLGDDGSHHKDTTLF